MPCVGATGPFCALCNRCASMDFRIYLRRDIAHPKPSNFCPYSPLQRHSLCPARVFCITHCISCQLGMLTPSAIRDVDTFRDQIRTQLNLDSKAARSMSDPRNLCPETMRRSQLLPLERRKPFEKTARYSNHRTKSEPTLSRRFLGSACRLVLITMFFRLMSVLWLYLVFAAWNESVDRHQGRPDVGECPSMLRFFRCFCSVRARRSLH
jgi:hypothetical protein